MLEKRVRIETADLECGMYVSQLDRPWLETPFLFQGFEIQDDKDLKLLRKTCKHVDVDATRGAVPREKVLHAHQKKEKYEKGLAVANGRREHVKPPSVQWRLFDDIARLDSSGTLAARFLTHKYDNVVATKTEAPKATLAYDAAAAVMNDVLGQLDQGKGLDAGKLKVAISPMIDSVMRNQDAMAWLVQLRKRDAYTYHHSLASSVWAVVLGRHLGFDRAGLLHRWRHPEPAVDQLAAGVIALVAAEQKTDTPRRVIFSRIWQLAHDGAPMENFDLLPRAAVPYLDEPWYC